MADIALHRDAIHRCLVPLQRAVEVNGQINHFGTRRWRLIVLGIAYQQSGSFGDQTKHFFTGDYRDKTTWMVVIGGIASVLGVIKLVLPVRGAVA